MPDVIYFDEALKRTHGNDRALLVGNGFSARYFSYHNLLERSKLVAGSSVRALFDALGTVDFEAVVRTLEAAEVVERAYGNVAHAEEIKLDAQRVREALVEAVNATHPAHHQDLGPEYTSSATFLQRFRLVFSLNYDLLLYWVSLKERRLSDGFGLGKPQGAFHGPFADGAHCHLYNLHGGLHLFEDAAGDLMKAIDTGAGVIATISNAIEQESRLPLYVAEGTSAQKMRKINSKPYLRYCYDTLRWNSAPIFVYGHSADENDAHIYRAIFSSKAEHMYFGVYKLGTEQLRELDGILSKYQKSAGSQIAYTFFDSESANVWGT